MCLKFLEKYRCMQVHSKTLEFTAAVVAVCLKSFTGPTDDLLTVQ